MPRPACSSPPNGRPSYTLPCSSPGPSWGTSRRPAPTWRLLSLITITSWKVFSLSVFLKNIFLWINEKEHEIDRCNHNISISFMFYERISSLACLDAGSIWWEGESSTKYPSISWLHWQRKILIRRRRSFNMILTPSDLHWRKRTKRLYRLSNLLNYSKFPVDDC